MTIRQHLYRRVSFVTWPAVAFMVIAVITLFVPPSDFLLNVVMASLVMLVLLLVGTLLTLKCPSCGASLASLIGYLGPLRKVGRKVKCCPFCAINLDEPTRL